VTEKPVNVSRAVAWVGAASGVVGAIDASVLAILMWKWVTTEQLGIASLAATLFFFIDLVTEAGLSSVLIQRERLDEDTISTVFWLNFGVSICAFLVLLGIAPVIGHIQGHPVVGTMLIVYGAKLLYQNVYFVPMALLRRELRFKELSIVRTISNFGEACTKIGFAAMGEPIWCFVAGPLVRVFIVGVGILLRMPWRPKRTFVRSEARDMLAFAAKTTGSQFLQHFYNNISYQIVGFYFGNAAVGMYRIAYEMVLYPINFVSNVVTQVAFPALARLRNTPSALAAQFIKFSRQNVAVALPLLVLLVVAANELLAILFPQVSGAALAVRLLCVVGLLRAIDCLYLPLLDALGFAGRNFQLAILAAVVLTSFDLLFVAILGDRIGYTAVAVGRMLGYPVVIAVHARLALGQLEMTGMSYVRHLMSLILLGAVSTVPGIVVIALLPGFAPAVRLLAGGGLSLVLLAILLSRIHGIGVRAILRDLRK
jgi:O-antigen/teichoic acid export membrane protein